MPSNEDEIIRYYNTRESKRGYSLFLRGAKHFGFYNKGDRAWQFQKALRQMEEQLAITLNQPKNAQVLDAGCGMGEVASYLAAVHALNIEGIDILDFNIAEARRRITQRELTKKIHVQEMSYSKLAFKNCSFDAVYTMETFVHASDPERVLAEFYRVLKPGGKLVMFEYSRDPNDKMGKRAAFCFETINRLAAMPAFQRFEHGVQQNLMSSAGYKNVQTEDITHNMLPMLKIFAIVAFVPYKFLTLMGLRKKVVNAMSAVEFWRYRQHFRYNIYSAVKPDSHK